MVAGTGYVFPGEEEAYHQLCTHFINVCRIPLHVLVSPRPLVNGPLLSAFPPFKFLP